MSSTPARSRSRSAARLAAVQALYQHEMEGTPLPRLLKEFHDHRLGATIEDETYHQAEHDFFDDIVVGAERSSAIDLPRAGRWSGSIGRCARSSAPAPMS
jgi:N utilization substance protein B